MNRIRKKYDKQQEQQQKKNSFYQQSSKNPENFTYEQQNE